MPAAAELPGEADEHAMSPQLFLSGRCAKHGAAPAGAVGTVQEGKEALAASPQKKGLFGHRGGSVVGFAGARHDIALSVTEWPPPIRERRHVPGEVDPIASVALRRIR